MARRMRRQNINFSKLELVDLLKSTLVIGAAFAIVQVGLALNSAEFYLVFGISLITVGSGFILHELAHKIVAQRYGCWAEFRSDDSMLFFTLIISLVGFVFAAPGAVRIDGVISKKQLGWISAAGPLTNIVLSILFFIVASFGGILTTVGMIGASINSWLALFNMIPFGPFDGAKILKWNKVAFGLIALAALALFIVF